MGRVADDCGQTSAGGALRAAVGIVSGRLVGENAALSLGRRRVCLVTVVEWRAGHTRPSGIGSQGLNVASQETNLRTTNKDHSGNDDKVRRGSEYVSRSARGTTHAHLRGGMRELRNHVTGGHWRVARHAIPSGSCLASWLDTYESQNILFDLGISTA